MPPERPGRIEPVLAVLAILTQAYPDARYYLTFSNPLELLVAALLSAQVKDEVVNTVTPALFKTYRTPRAYAEADLEALIRLVSRVSFAGAKARHIQAACRIIEDQHGGQVPDTIETLTRLPGIGRKTANVILINGFQKIVGIVVDTHVIRVAGRLGWTRWKDPEKIEQDLMRQIPREDWARVTWLLKAHGRAVCRAPVPACSRCTLVPYCPKAGVTRHE